MGINRRDKLVFWENSEGTQTDRLKQIGMQFYWAGYFHIVTDVYYDSIRMGYPAFSANPETDLNNENDKSSMRYLYSDLENSYNKDQFKAVLER